MSLAGLLSAIADDPQYRQVADLASAGDGGAFPGDGADVTAPAALRPFLAAALTGLPGRASRFLLAITATAREAEELTGALSSLLPAGTVAYFPAWETLPHERLSPRSDTSGQRLAVLRRLAHPDPGSSRTAAVSAVVTPVRALLQPMVGGLADVEPVVLAEGDTCDLDEVLTRLVDIGYTRTDLVERRGELVVRGGIIDVFPPAEEHPVRVELFGDIVEETRFFRVADQRSLGPAPEGLWAPPCRELLLTPDVRDRAKHLAADHPGLADVLGKLADGITVEGMEALAPVLAPRMELLLDHVPAGGVILACDPERIRARAADLVRTSREFLEASWVNAAAGGQAPVDLGASAFQSITQVRAAADNLRLPWWTITPFDGSAADAGAAAAGAAPASTDGGPGEADEGGPDVSFFQISESDSGSQDRPALRLGAGPAPAYRGDTSRALTDVRGWLGEGWRVVLITEGHGPAQRLAEVLRGEGLGARLGDLDEVPEPGVPCVTTGLIPNGFTWESVRLAVLTEADLVGQHAGPREVRRMPSRRRGGIDPLQLTPGDYVVHEQHGVGRYQEMTSRSIQGAVREYLVIEYAPGKRGQPPDRLYVPTDQLDQVTRYVGGEMPSLHRLGGADWAKTKGRARKAVRQIASELIRLYSARMASSGHAFAPDTPWQRELEDAFPYVETADQLAAIDEAKQDMERPVPMDRLICGDVGYGKTEVAIRATFKAVQDGMQVAVLVPTTLLASQHGQTFRERFANYPVRVEVLSRFLTAKEQTEVINGARDGTVDIVIGTHRLLGADISFKDIGLLIVDEEQRFGVQHKERIKEWRTNVDVLTLTATPIPRTLEMSLTGIRDLSLVNTPPEDRQPILTYVGEYDARAASEAIRRELLREGQVLYVHNRVHDIEHVADDVKRLVPEARVAIAHGQMDEGRLERVVQEFWEHDYDVLVCTTIVESGLDMPTVNTLVVDRADLLGLAQLYQLRGRVGRRGQRAYAYLLHPRDRALTEEAYERLKTIGEFTDLGSGFKIAMRDLEIRGAGNLLGAEQSGHIAAVGFDLYVEMVTQAVGELTGTAPEEPTEVQIDVPVTANLPREYIARDDVRMEAYRRLAAVTTLEDVDDVRNEWEDRYGPPTPSAEALLDVARLGAVSLRLGIR